MQYQDKSDSVKAILRDSLNKPYSQNKGIRIPFIAEFGLSHFSSGNVGKQYLKLVQRFGCFCLLNSHV